MLNDHHSVVLLLILLQIVQENALNLDSQTTIEPKDGEDAVLTVPEIIAKYGYPIEVHNVTTEDGYILQTHRIPYGKLCGAGKRKKVAWLQHGLLADSSNFILPGEKKALAYLLADACYDVWLGNSRGNKYSKLHEFLPVNPNSPEYWQFSWDEMGRYDLPASFDYVLNLTGADALYYTGYSMGATVFFVCMSERPEYNSKIKLMTALGPISYTEHITSPIRHIASWAPELIAQILGTNEFLPSSKSMNLYGRTHCRKESIAQSICSNIFFLLMGYNTDQMDKELLPIMMGHLPSGSSVRSVRHYAQGVNSGKFQKYDLGSTMNNQEVYGQETPPEYNISKITAPIAIYWGDNDWLGVKTDIYRFAKQLPKLQQMRKIVTFNHIDFINALDLVHRVNKPSMDLMTQF